MQHRNKVQLARTMAICGIAISAIAARPAHAQSPEYEASSPARIYVDCAATSRGNGSAKRPYWRITDVLDSARELRREDPRRIVIVVLQGSAVATSKPSRPDRRLARRSCCHLFST